MSEEKNDIMELRIKDYRSSSSFTAVRKDSKHAVKIEGKNCDKYGRPDIVRMTNDFNYSYIDENGKVWDIKWKHFGLLVLK